MSVLLIVVLVGGFVLLAVGANFFVDGAADVARRFSVPAFLIGMTVVAIGTSLPELAVTISASIRGDNAMAISNVIGSDMFNTLVVISVVALVTPVVFSRRAVRRDFPISIVAVVILLVLGALGMKVGRLDGIILLAIFVLFLYWTIRSAKQSPPGDEEAEAEVETETVVTEIRELSKSSCILCLVIGGAAVVAGGWLAVGAAEVFAERLGLTGTFVGMTICAIGTSLPEIVTCVAATRKDQQGMAVGNVIGSNIFNILLVAGVAATIHPIGMTQEDLIDLVFILIAVALVLLFIGSERQLGRWAAVMLIFIYFIYMLYVWRR